MKTLIIIFLFPAPKFLPRILQGCGQEFIHTSNKGTYKGTRHMNLPLVRVWKLSGYSHTAHSCGIPEIEVAKSNNNSQK